MKRKTLAILLSAIVASNMAVAGTIPAIAAPEQTKENAKETNNNSGVGNDDFFADTLKTIGGKVIDFREDSETSRDYEIDYAFDAGIGFLYPDLGKKMLGNAWKDTVPIIMTEDNGNSATFAYLNEAGCEEFDKVYANENTENTDDLLVGEDTESIETDPKLDELIEKLENAKDEDYDKAEKELSDYLLSEYNIDLNKELEDSEDYAEGSEDYYEGTEDYDEGSEDYDEDCCGDGFTWSKYCVPLFQIYKQKSGEALPKDVASKFDKNERVATWNGNDYYMLYNEKPGDKATVSLSENDKKNIETIMADRENFKKDFILFKEYPYADYDGMYDDAGEDYIEFGEEKSDKTDNDTAKENTTAKESDAASKM